MKYLGIDDYKPIVVVSRGILCGLVLPSEMFRL